MGFRLVVVARRPFCPATTSRRGAAPRPEERGGWLPAGPPSLARIRAGAKKRGQLDNESGCIAQFGQPRPAAIRASLPNRDAGRVANLEVHDPGANRDPALT
jgi:hypothetical protein